jgi:hypothetical protein
MEVYYVEPIIRDENMKKHGRELTPHSHRPRSVGFRKTWKPHTSLFSCVHNNGKFKETWKVTKWEILLSCFLTAKAIKSDMFFPCYRVKTILIVTTQVANTRPGLPTRPRWPDDSSRPNSKKFHGTVSSLEPYGQASLA